MDSLKAVENLLFLFDLLFSICEGLERVSNLPQGRELRVHSCPHLRCVDKLDSLQQVGLHESMDEVSSLWMPGLQQQCRELQGEDLDVYN
uniref:Uncharacterized protein n=1 Tax=Arundo donax TaxID=35708 RepID=A0A0A9BMK2_ARUDO